MYYKAEVGDANCKRKKCSNYVKRRKVLILRENILRAISLLLPPVH